MKSQFIYPLPTIDVHKRKPALGKVLKKIAAMSFGAAAFIIGFCVCFIVGGIIPGIFIMMGAGVIAFSRDIYQVNCPSCNKKMYVAEKQEDFKCKRCEQLAVVNWIPYKK